MPSCFGTTLPFRPPRSRGGFTLIEAALATIIIGVGVVSMMQLFAALTSQNAVSAQETSAMMLANNVVEAVAALPFNDPQTGTRTFGPETGQVLATFDDIDDFDGQSFNPPIDAMRQPIAALSAYSQVVSVVPVYSNQPTNGPTAKTTYTGAVRVTVIILHRPPNHSTAGEIYRTSWLRMDG